MPGSETSQFGLPGVRMRFCCLACEFCASRRMQELSGVRSGGRGAKHSGATASTDMEDVSMRIGHKDGGRAGRKAMVDKRRIKKVGNCVHPMAATRCRKHPMLPVRLSLASSGADSRVTMQAAVRPHFARTCRTVLPFSGTVHRTQYAYPPPPRVCLHSTRACMLCNIVKGSC
jgi:hypothetical protein